MTLLRDFFFSQTHTQPCCFHPLGVYTNPPPLVPPFLLTLNQSPKGIAGSDITNYLTHTMYAKAFKVACELCRHWRFRLILSRAETYHVFLKTILFNTTECQSVAEPTRIGGVGCSLANKQSFMCHSRGLVWHVINVGMSASVV